MKDETKQKQIEEMEFEEIDKRRIIAESIFRQLVQAQAQVAGHTLALAAKGRQQLLLDHSADMKKFFAEKQEIAAALANSKSEVEWLDKQFKDAQAQIRELLKKEGKDGSK